MKARTIFALLIILSMLITSVGYAITGAGIGADEGKVFLENVSGTPDQETERANLNHMAFYVPMQNANGRLLTEEDTATQYVVLGDGDWTVHETRLYAKPLVTVYIDSLDHETDLGSGGAGLGAHDAYAAVSLDDGATWKRTNLSNSAHLSSFTLDDGWGESFPGDAHNMTFAIAGDKVLVGWISRYCAEGAPLYRFSDENIAALQDAFGLPDLYVHDIWGVNGAQGSVDYTEQGFPEVGEIPYSCVWAARGQLLPVTLSPENDPHEGYDIVWLEAERLTSGVRDANRLEMNGDAAAGFMMTWQEDPEGLRPGQGLGPGEGWSGAVVWQDTDLWYSFISIEDFDLVTDSGGVLTEAIPLGQYITDEVATRPQYAVPMAVPVRLTDNAKCMANNNSKPYCYINFDDDNPWLTELPDNWVDLGHSTDSTFCADTVEWMPPGADSESDAISLCVAEDGRVLGGRVGASRPRVNVQPYNSLFIEDETDDDTWYDSGIVIMGAEESKALGTLEEDLDVIEIGKNMMYYSFDLLNPSFVRQGGQLNWPAKDPLNDGAELPMLSDEWGNDFYDTEIARRFSHMSQPIHQFGESGVSSVLIVKQGIINQGGPADIFLRFTKADTSLIFTCDANDDGVAEEQCLPEGYNPYAYQNLVCEDWAYTDGSNPRYIEGYCLDTGVNVSGVTSECDGIACGEFPWDGGEEFPKVTKWDQTVDNLDDESWENPWDVAKGHRGFIDGDFVMMMYAWSPNWKANTVGNDHYNLYARRSFDGGVTWTTTPADLGGNGTTTCEYYGTGEDAEEDCTTYGAGQFEKARNLSQLIGNRETILDPRYTPTGGLKMLPVTDKFELSEDLPYIDDEVRDPSKFFIVYETGDNTTVAEGEAVPMDLYYSRATVWGDYYDLVERTTTTGDVVEEFDFLERDPEYLSGEAANTCNPSGTFYYAIWNQWQEDAEENISNSDAILSRKMWLADDDEADYLPRTSILYVSTDKADYYDPDIVLVGSARDTDRVGNDSPDDDGIDQAGWWVTIREDSHYYEGRTFQRPPSGFVLGRHDFSFRAQDNEGNWSEPKTVTIWIAEKFYNVYLPTVTR